MQERHRVVWAVVLWASGCSASAGGGPTAALEVSVLSTPRNSRFDASGLERLGGQLVVVSDKSAYPHVYAVGAADQGWRPLSPVLSPSGGVGDDVEGLAVCGDRLLAIEEAGALVWIAADGAPTRLPLTGIDSGGLLPDRSAWGNKGIEGVACAPDGRVWVAKEREPRAIYRVDGTSGRVTHAWDQWARTDSPTWMGSDLSWPSFSGLHFTDGRLYALHRDGRKVLALDPDDGRVLDTMHLALDESALYNTDHGWGMAEGLLIEDDRVWVVIDNNKDTLKQPVGQGEPRPLLLAYPRPKGF